MASKGNGINSQIDFHVTCWERVPFSPFIFSKNSDKGSSYLSPISLAFLQWPNILFFSLPSTVMTPAKASLLKRTTIYWWICSVIVWHLSCSTNLNSHVKVKLGCNAFILIPVAFFRITSFQFFRLYNSLQLNAALSPSLVIGFVNSIYTMSSSLIFFDVVIYSLLPSRDQRFSLNDYLWPVTWMNGIIWIFSVKSSAKFSEYAISIRVSL
jgi:hypothetical protein